MSIHLRPGQTHLNLTHTQGRASPTNPTLSSLRVLKTQTFVVGRAIPGAYRVQSIVVEQCPREQGTVETGASELLTKHSIVGHYCLF